MSLWHVNEGSYELPPAACRTEPILRRAAASEEQREQQQAEGEGGEDVQDGKPGGQGSAKLLDILGSCADAALDLWCQMPLWPQALYCTFS